MSDESSASLRRDLFVLTMMALAVRLTWVYRGAGVSGDSHYYLTAARNLAFHHVFSNSQNVLDLAPTANRPPLYSTLIAALWWTDSAPLTAVIILQAVLGAATVTLVYLIARDRFKRDIALLAGAGMALAPMSSYFTSLILTETLFTFLLTLGCFFWGRERPVYGGIALGLAALTKTTILPFLVILLLVPLLPIWRERWRTYVMIALTAVAISSVWVIRNAVTFGEFIPVAAGGSGVNLLFGTVETKLTSSQIWTGTKWSTKQSDHPLPKLDSELPEMERDQARARRALRLIADDPLHWLVVRAKQYPKLYTDTGPYIFYPHNTPVEGTPPLPRSLVTGIRVTFVLVNLGVLALVAFGMLVLRAQFGSLGHITLFPIFLSVVHLPMWIEPRYSLPMVPLTAILASVGAIRLISKLELGMNLFHEASNSPRAPEL